MVEVIDHQTRECLDTAHHANHAGINSADRRVRKGHFVRGGAIANSDHLLLLPVVCSPSNIVRRSVLIALVALFNYFVLPSA